MALVTSVYDSSKMELGVRKSRVPSYSCVVNGKDNAVADAREYFKKMTANESWLFWTMDQKKDINTNEVKFSREDCDKGKISSYPVIVKGLIDKGLIIRLKQNYYIMNPNVVTPKFDRYREVLSYWIKSGGKN